MQLDAFLRSAETYAPYASITVLEDANNHKQHALAYRSLRDRADDWWYTVGIEDVTRDFLAVHDRVVFHTDDDVFFQSWDGDVAGVTYEGDNAPPSTFTFRLGTNTTYCHPLGVEQEPPETDNDYAMNWRWCDGDLDFGYPLCLNGTVYRSADLLPLLDFPFHNPTVLEAGLDYRKELFRPQWMTAPLRSCCVSLPHNRVSSSSGCLAGSNPEWQPDALLGKYLDGWRIDLDAMDFSDIRSAHQEVPLAFKKGA